MEIVLLVAILAVAGSALFVAFTFTKHIGLLARKTDLDLIMSKAASDISGQVSALRDELNSQLERQRELIAGVENRVLGQEEQGADPQEMDTLKAALLEAEAFVARDGWGQPPRLFSLAPKSALVAADSELAAKLEDAEPGALIPVLQEDLPPGEPFDVLANVRWPDEVVGCVLVTEIVTLPPETEKDTPDDPATAERWAAAHSGSKTARLAVSVTRTGGYLCGLRLKGDDSIQVGTDLADDLVAALLGTF